MTHELKIEKQWADAKLAGEKPFEIRRNDRGFQKGDRVKYTVVDPKTHEKMWFDFGDGCGQQCHALEKCEFEITYVREGTDNGLQPGYCVFADRPVPAWGLDLAKPGSDKAVLAVLDVNGGAVRKESWLDGFKKQFETWVSVKSSDGTVIDTTNYRPQDGDSDELLDAKIEFYTLNHLTIADDRMLARLSETQNAGDKQKGNA